MKVSNSNLRFACCIYALSKYDFTHSPSMHDFEVLASPFHFHVVPALEHHFVHSHSPHTLILVRQSLPNHTFMHVILNCIG